MKRKPGKIGSHSSLAAEYEPAFTTGKTTRWCIFGHHRLNLVLLAAVSLLCTVGASGQEITQTFTLRPGWNVIYIEVLPPDRSPAAVFGNLPLASVWTRAERLTSAAFIQDPSEEAFNRAGWLSWFPPSRPEAFLSTLSAVLGNRAYLLKITGNAPATLVIRGQPSLRRAEWIPDAYNLRGFPVNNSSPPTFQDYFRGASAHYDSSVGKLEKIFRLNDNGQWVLVSPSDRMRRDEAYWVFSRGASDFSAPFEVMSELGDGVDFDAATEQFDLELRNCGGTAKTVRVQLKSASAAGALAHRVFAPAQGGYQWPDLPASSLITLTPGGSEKLKLAIRRGVFPGATYSALLEITDLEGSQFWVPVRAGKPETGGAQAGHPSRGLWVGTASIEMVNEVNSNTPTDVTKTQAAFPLRLLLHVDTAGRTRFLKEVVQMWRNGTYTNDANGLQVMERPGEYVLLTDDRLIGSFQGATLRDGLAVGRRLSTAGFDFEGGQTNYLEMSGSFAKGNRLGVAITLGPNFPTNPFRHKYHPDHDNLDGRFVPLTNHFEAYAVTREIELEFTSTDPTGAASPDFGYTIMGGIYRETLTGLHKAPIRVRGTFRLSRASYIAGLNPSPNP